MKQLKFMLAAATVIGLATAAQAETQVVNKPIDSENFNAMNVGDKVTADTVGFDYTGAAAENDSEIVQVTSGDNALKVNTGTDPLLRAIEFSEAARPVDLTAEKFQKLYIDTKVKFTVTPYTDEVVAKTGDKLMVYLKESTNYVEGVLTYSTNLVVTAAAYDADEAAVVSRPYTIEGTEIDPDEFYNLRVTAKSIPMSSGDNGVGYWTVFQVYINDFVNPLTTTVGSGFDDVIPEDVELDLPSTFVSLQTENLEGDISSDNNEITKVTYVGFAGEGYVDDLVFTKDVEEETVVNFTFAIDIDGGVSSVVYTIGEGESAVDATITADAAAITVASGSKVTLKEINLNALYVLASDSAKENDFKTISAAGESFVVKTSALTGEGESAVPAGTTAAQIGITNTEFEKADNTQLNSLVKWATSAGKGSLELVNSMTFDSNGNPSGDGKTAAEAYLLDCATTEVESKKDEFKLTITFDENGDPVVNGPNGPEKYKNGNIVLKGREKLSEGNWVDKAEGHKFFKAFLTK